MEQNQQPGANQRLTNMGGIVTRVLAVFGFIAIIGIGMWGSISIASGVPGAFSSLASAFVSLTSVFVPANEAVTLSIPSMNVTSGTPFVLSWTNTNQSGSGSYTFRYDCADGVYFTSPAPSGTDANVYCNVPFNFLNSNNAISLTPFSTTNRFIDVTIYIDYTPNGASKPTVTGKAAITIENDSLSTSPSAVATSTPAQTQPTQTQPRITTTAGPMTTQTFPLNGSGTVTQFSNPNGQVDLVSRVIEVGIITPNGTFISSSTPSLGALTGGNRVAVHFAIENDGTKTSPQFVFNAVLPTLPINIFTSPTQRSLAPGDRIEYTLGFDSFDPSGTGTFVINADPSGSINEQNKANNILRYTITTTR